PSSELVRLPASLSRARPARLSPSNSFASGRSIERGFPGPTSRSSAEVTFGTDDPDLRLVEHALHESIARLCTPGQFLPAVHDRIDGTAELRAGVLQYTEHVGVGELVADNHQVDIAARSIAPLRYRTVYKGRGDARCERCKRLAQRRREADSLADNSDQLFVQRGLGICLVVLLRSEPADHDQARRLQPRQLALDRARTGAGPTDQLGCVEAALRLAEQKREHALLRVREERIGEAFAPRTACSCLRSTHFGHLTTQFRHAQVHPERSARI